MKCPGQDTQFWNCDAIFETQCPECGAPLEFFKDDATRRCGQCKKKIVNPKMDFGCASYCQFAQECLGTLPEEFVAQREDLFKDKVAVEMKRHYGRDFKRIGRATRTARYAEQMGKEEKGNLGIILCASYLHDMETGQARALMEKLGARPELIQAVCTAIDKETDKDNMDINAEVVRDAIFLDRMTDCTGKGELDAQALAGKIKKVFLTPAGRKLARKVLLDPDSASK